MDSGYAESFKFSLADTVFCFVLLKLCFTGEILRFPKYYINQSKMVFLIAFEHPRRSMSAIHFVLDIVHTILALLIIQNTQTLHRRLYRRSRKLCKRILSPFTRAINFST